MLGFDIDATTLILHREALAAGATPNNANGPDGIRDVAEAHLHGLESSRCSLSPCRAAGLCHALYELVQYRREAADPQGVIAAATERPPRSDRASRFWATDGQRGERVGLK